MIVFFILGKSLHLIVRILHVSCIVGLVCVWIVISLLWEIDCVERDFNCSLEVLAKQVSSNKIEIPSR